MQTSGFAGAHTREPVRDCTMIPCIVVGGRAMVAPGKPRGTASAMSRCGGVQHRQSWAAHSGTVRVQACLLFIVIIIIIIIIIVFFLFKFI